MTMIEYAERLRDIISVLREAEYLARHEWLDRDMSAQPPEQGPHIVNYIAQVDRFGVCEGIRVDIPLENGGKATFTNVQDSDAMNTREPHVITPDDLEFAKRCLPIQSQQPDGWAYYYEAKAECERWKEWASKAVRLINEDMSLSRDSAYYGDDAIRDGKRLLGEVDDET